MLLPQIWIEGEQASIQKLYIKLQSLLSFFFLYAELGQVVGIFNPKLSNYIYIHIIFLFRFDFEFKSKMLCCRQFLGGLCDSLVASLCLLAALIFVLSTLWLLKQQNAPLRA